MSDATQSHTLPKPPITLAQLAQILPQATLVGDGSVTVKDLVHPRLFQSPDELVLLIEAAALAILKTGQVKAAIVAKEITDAQPIPDGALAGYITVERPKHALAYLLNIFDKPPHTPPTGIHPTAFVEPTAQVHPSAQIGAHCYVGDGAQIDANTVLMPQVTIGAQAKIGKNNLFYSGVRIGERVMVGSNVIIHFNASIGSDGFSFVTPEKGSVEAAKEGKTSDTRAQNTEIIRINSVGTVIIEDHVEIGACTCIDRSTLGATHIKRGTKIDNLVQIGHNNTIGENCLIVGQAGIAGSCQIGNRVVIAGQAGFADHIKVGDDAIVTAKAGVMRDIEPKEIVAGIPAQPAREALRNISLIGKLSDTRKEIKSLEKRLKALEAQLALKKEPTPV